MNLEHIARQSYRPAKTAGPEVDGQIQLGKKCIVVQDDIDDAFIPDNYTLIDMWYGSENFKVLVPQKVLFYIANEGEGNDEDALDDLADFYDESIDIEDDAMERGELSVTKAHWSTLGRSAYKTYCINKLVTHGNGRDDDGEPLADFDSKIIDSLDLNDEYVDHLVKAIAGLALDKSDSELKAYNIDRLVKHVSVGKTKKLEISKEEFEKITCWAGSHYEIKDEYRTGNESTKYHIEKRHDREFMKGTKEVRFTETVDEVTIREFERKIDKYRQNKGSTVGKHDHNLIRTYVNLKYVAAENKNKQLEIIPPINWDAKKEITTTKR